METILSTSQWESLYEGRSWSIEEYQQAASRVAADPATGRQEKFNRLSAIAIVLSRFQNDEAQEKALEVEILAEKFKSI